MFDTWRQFLIAVGPCPATWDWSIVETNVDPVNVGAWQVGAQRLSRNGHANLATQSDFEGALQQARLDGKPYAVALVKCREQPKQWAEAILTP